MVLFLSSFYPSFSVFLCDDWFFATEAFASLIKDPGSCLHLLLKSGDSCCTTRNPVHHFLYHLSIAYCREQVQSRTGCKSIPGLTQRWTSIHTNGQFSSTVGVGGNQSTWRNLCTCTGRLSENSTQKGTQGSNLEPSCCELTVLTTTLPCSPSFYSEGDNAFWRIPGQDVTYKVMKSEAQWSAGHLWDAWWIQVMCLGCPLVIQEPRTRFYTGYKRN